jgi:hypothetical protein
MTLILTGFLALSMLGSVRLDAKDARKLIENIPDFLSALKAKRCPEAELLWSGEQEFAFQLRSQCTNSPSGLIGNFIVDRETAEVWVGVDRDKPVRSAHLEKIQNSLRKALQRGDGKD